MHGGESPAEFDEAWYLLTYPDVARAVEIGEVASGLAHYVAHGRQEGRKPGPPFDPGWYAQTYPFAVAEAGSHAEDALERHYRERGRHRGYLPHRQAKRPRNAAELRSPFGGLWIDAANAPDLIEGRRALGLIDDDDAARLATFATKGYVILPSAVPAELVDLVDQAFEAAYHGEFPALRFECHGISQEHVTWQPELLQHPARAVDLHWFAEAVRDAMFCPAILRFLHLIFERPVLASQTLAFYLGSRQQIHKDSAYVPYSLPLQFVATWMALEDVEAGTGELEYFVESHRKLPEFLYNGSHKSVHDAARRGAGNNILTDDVARHLDAIQREAQARHLARERFLARRGDVLFWHADLAHGGAPTASQHTRKSLVTHYCPSEVAPLYFENGQSLVRQHPSGSYYTSGTYFS